MMSQLRELIPGAADWPRFVHAMPVAAGIFHLAGLERFDPECLDGLEVSGIRGNDSEYVFDGGGGDEGIGE